MVRDDISEPIIHETISVSPVETWVSSIPQLRDEIERLNQLLTELQVDEKESQEQLRSLTYALGLTRGEVVRRKRSNNELRTAYQFRSGDAAQDDSVKFAEVQRLEGELLNEKRDSANMEYEVEQLQFKLKRLQEDTLSLPIQLHEAVSPASPGLRSPQLTILSSKSISTPPARPSRLIGDVDALVKFSESDEYAPCRLGVSASGHMALYSYNSAMPLLRFEEEHASSGELSEEDKAALIENLQAIEVLVGMEQFELVGLKESIESAMQLMEETSDSIRASDVFQ